MSAAMVIRPLGRPGPGLLVMAHGELYAASLAGTSALRRWWCASSPICAENDPRWEAARIALADGRPVVFALRAL